MPGRGSQTPCSTRSAQPAHLSIRSGILGWWRIGRGGMRHGSASPSPLSRSAPESVRPRCGRPAPSSDQAAAAVGDEAYVVGGYTGSTWLNTIVAWRPGGTAHVVARLPVPVRYAGVAAAGGKVVIAGGSLRDGTASRAVYVFDPNSHDLRRLGSLPAPTTHAAAAAVGDRVLLI